MAGGLGAPAPRPFHTHALATLFVFGVALRWLPVGYAYKDNGNGTYSFGFNVDLIVKSPSGEIVGGQENFQRLELTSRAKNREFMLTLTLDLTNAPPGDYVLEYKTHDLNSDKVGLMSLPFTLTK